MFERAIDRNLLPYCELYGIATLIRSPLCHGLLGGQFTEATTFSPSDTRSADAKFQPPRFTQYLAAVERLRAFAAQHYGKSVAELAVRWVLDRPGVAATLCTAKSSEQLATAAASLGWHLDTRARRFVEEIVRQAVTDPVGLWWQGQGSGMSSPGSAA